MEQNPKKIISNIIFWLIVLFFAQLGLVDLALYSIKAPYVFFWPLLIIDIIFHILSGVLLIKMRKKFYLEHTDQYLNHVNLANLLTMCRLSSLPTICAFLIIYRSYPLILPWLIGLTAFAFLTDLLDGTVSRLTKQVTKIGRFLDSTSDYLLLGCVSITLLALGFLPLWFFILIIVRLVAHAISMLIIGIRQGWLAPDSSFLGKASIFATMTLYVAELMRLFGFKAAWVEPGMIFLEIGAGVVVAASIIDKTIYTLSKHQAITDGTNGQSSKE